MSTADAIASKVKQFQTDIPHQEVLFHYGDDQKWYSEADFSVQGVSSVSSKPEVDHMTKEVTYFFALEGKVAIKTPPASLQGQIEQYGVSVQAVMKNNNIGNKIYIFDSVPQTTAGSTTTSNSTSYSVSGNVGFMGDGPTGGISGSATISSSTSRTVSDVTTRNIQSSDNNNCVIFYFDINNKNSSSATSFFPMDISVVYRIDGQTPNFSAYLDIIKSGGTATEAAIEERAKQIVDDSEFKFFVRVFEKHNGRRTISRPISISAAMPAIFLDGKSKTRQEDISKFLTQVAQDSTKFTDKRKIISSEGSVGDCLIFDPYYTNIEDYKDAYGSGGGNNVLLSNVGNQQQMQLTSENGRFTLTMLLNGNLVLRNEGTPWWASNSGVIGKSVKESLYPYFLLQQNMDMCIQNVNRGNTESVPAINIKKDWSNSNNSLYSRLVMQDDGNLVQYDKNNNSIWSSDFDLTSKVNYEYRIPNQEAFGLTSTKHNGDICIAYSGSHSSDLYIGWCSADNLKSWYYRQLYGQNSDSATVASFGGWLYMVYKSYHGREIFTTRTQNYTDWQTNILPNQQTSQNPSVAAFGSYMYIVYRSNTGSAMFVTRTSDGVNWVDMKIIPNQSAFYVSMAVFKNMLFMVYSAEHSSQLYVSWTEDGLTWDFQQIDGQGADTVGLTASDNWMYMAYSGANNSNIYVTRSGDGKKWNKPQEIYDQHGGSTTATFANNRLVIIYSSSPPINIMAYTE